MVVEENGSGNGGVVFHVGSGDLMVRVTVT